jgi:hypothetical protein
MMARLVDHQKKEPSARRGFACGGRRQDRLPAFRDRAWRTGLVCLHSRFRGRSTHTARSVRAARSIRAAGCLHCLSGRLAGTATSIAIGATGPVGTTRRLRCLGGPETTGSIRTARSVRTTRCLHGNLGGSSLARWNGAVGKRVGQGRPGQDESDDQCGRRKQIVTHRNPPMLGVLEQIAHTKSRDKRSAG